MEELIQNVENRVRILLQKQSDLKKSNDNLQHSKRQLELENEKLIFKHKKVVGSIENTITKIKLIEGMT